MTVFAVAFLLAAVLIRHRVAASALSLLALLLIVGALDGHPVATLAAASAALVLRVLWGLGRDCGERELLDRRRGWRFEPYACPDCGQPWEQREVWDAHAGEWRFAAPPYGFCPVCHPQYAR